MQLWILAMVHIMCCNVNVVTLTKLFLGMSSLACYDLTLFTDCDQPNGL